MTFGEGFLLGVPRQCHPCFSATSWGFHGQTDRCGICCNTGKWSKSPSFPASQVAMLGRMMQSCCLTSFLRMQGQTQGVLFRFWRNLMINAEGKPFFRAVSSRGLRIFRCSYFRNLWQVCHLLKCVGDPLIPCNCKLWCKTDQASAPASCGESEGQMICCDTLATGPLLDCLDAELRSWRMMGCK